MRTPQRTLKAIRKRLDAKSGPIASEDEIADLLDDADSAARLESIAHAAHQLVTYWQAHHPILLQAEFGKPLLEAVEGYFGNAPADKNKDE